MKKLIAALTAALISLTLLAACGKSEEAAEDTYTGVLTKVRLGMPMKKVISLNSATEMYYESDTEIWCVNPDTDLMEIRELIPADNQFYYAEDSLITYKFRFDESDGENYLEGYIEEVPCLIDRETAMKYYEDKKARLAAKYSVPAEAAISTITGTEDVDLNLDYVTTMTLSSFELVLTMQLTYDIVDGVEDYYGTYYSIELKELKNKTPVASSSEK